MLSHLLVSSDAAESSDAMLECVKALRRVGARRVTLVHVLDVRFVGGLYEQLRRQVLPKLEAQQRILEAEGYRVDVEVPWGVPFVELNRLATERSCSCIVVGSRGSSFIQQILLGSTAYSVIQNGSVPVFLVRLEILQTAEDVTRCRALCREPFQHVLFPTDFSDTAERAFQYIEHIAYSATCEVTLLHVQDEVKIGRHLKHRLAEFNRIDRERLERMRDRLLAAGCSAVHIEIPYGSPTRIILERARANQFTSIVMGAQGRGFIREVFLGGVAHNVARHAPLPVLFVPAVR